MVAEYEERAAAVLCGYSWGEWLRADRNERIQNVGFYRTYRLVELHIDDISERESKARARRQTRNRGV